MEDILYQEPGRLIPQTKLVMLPVDGSRDTARAATVAYEFSELTKSKLLIVYIVNLGSVHQIATMTEEDELQVLKRYMESGHKMLDGYKTAAEEYGIEVELIIDRGLPSDKIVQIAKERRVDLIVMGAGGTGSPIRTGVGSATERVIRRVRCAVLVVKALKERGKRARPSPL